METNIQTQLSQGGVDVAVTLARFGGNEALFLKFLKRFPTDPTYETLKTELQNQSREGIKDACHTLKGVSGNLGLSPLFEACSNMMALLRADEQSDATTAFVAVQTSYQQAVEMITNLDV